MIHYLNNHGTGMFSRRQRATKSRGLFDTLNFGNFFDFNAIAVIRKNNLYHSRPQSPRSIWPVAGIESSGPDFLSMRRAFVSYSRPIRFDRKSVNRGLPVLDQARALDPCHRPEGSWALGTRMNHTAATAIILFAQCPLYLLFFFVIKSSVF